MSEAQAPQTLDELYQRLKATPKSPRSMAGARLLINQVVDAAESYELAHLPAAAVSEYGGRQPIDAESRAFIREQLTREDFVRAFMEEAASPAHLAMVACDYFATHVLTLIVMGAMRAGRAEPWWPDVRCRVIYRLPIDGGDRHWREIQRVTVLEFLKLNDAKKGGAPCR